MYVCICKGITDSQIQQALNNGADYKSLREDLGVATDCGQCGNHCKNLVKENQATVEFYEATVAA